MLPMDMKYAMLCLYMCLALICTSTRVRGVPASAGVTPQPRIGRLSTQQQDPLELDSASLRAPDADSHSDHAAGASDATHAFSEWETSDMYTVARPYVISDSTIGGLAAPELQAELEAELQGQQRVVSAAGALRGLLHGRLEPRKYPTCSRCRIVQCRRSRGGRRCTGHCRTATRLLNCSSSSISMAACAVPDPPPTIEELRSLGPSRIDAIAEYDTVVVTAEAPYIGCADIANRPSSCPAPGTRATLGRLPATVMSSRCISEYYLAFCEPLLPFGVCDCLYRLGSARPGSRRARFTRRPCRTSELAAGSGVGGADGTPSDADITVLPAGNITQTWFSNFTDPGQEPRYRFSLTTSVRGTDVDVSLDIYQGVISYTDYPYGEVYEGPEDGEGYHDNAYDYGYDYGDEPVPSGDGDVLVSPVDGLAI